MKLSVREVELIVDGVNTITPVHQSHYAILDLYPMKTMIYFIDHVRYLLISDNYITLFGNKYYGVLLFFKERFSGNIKVISVYVHGDAVVVGDYYRETNLEPIGRNSDIIHEKELSPENLTRHFSEKYQILRQENPELFEEQLIKVLQANLKLHIDEFGNLKI